ncbi:hypothetical protein [Gilliamella sp. GillExp13]|uniref:hypothetical protein n=1 Tax=Gilliamella sp. GillExp13 TaxID=3120243 RepID=UPI00159ECA7B|nr:hypothetical protein [Gilliamella apicola]
MYNYADAGLVDDLYWTSDAAGSNQFAITSGDGGVLDGSASYSNYAVCSAL